MVDVPPAEVSTVPSPPAEITVGPFLHALMILTDKINAAITCYERNPLTAWEFRGYDTASAEDGYPGGNSTYIALGTSYQLVAQTLVLAHAFRDTGAIHIQATIGVVDTDGVSIMPTITAAIVSRNDWDASGSVDPALRGVLDTSPETHVEMELTGHSTLATSSEQTVTLDVWLAAEGHALSRWTYAVSGAWRVQTQPSAVTSASDSICGSLTSPFDPTRDKLLELHLKCRAPDAAQTITLKSTRALFYNYRSGVGY